MQSETLGFFLSSVTALFTLSGLITKYRVVQHPANLKHNHVVCSGLSSSHHAPLVKVKHSVKVSLITVAHTIHP